MVKTLVIYYSRTGTTKAMAEAVAEGAEEAGGEVEVLAVEDAESQKLMDADVVLIGSPTYYGHSAAPIRQFIDDSVNYHGQLRGKVGGAFASAHNAGGGNETTILDILHSLLVHGFVIEGEPDGDHYGPVAVGKPVRKTLSQCRRLGERSVKLAWKLKADSKELE